MKKEKIFLLMLVVAACISGMLAFKTQKSLIVAYYTCNTIAQSCSITITSGDPESLTTAPKPGLVVLTTMGGTTLIDDAVGCWAQNCANTLFFNPNSNGN